MTSTNVIGVLGAGVMIGESSFRDKTGECFTTDKLLKTGTAETGSNVSSDAGDWMARLSKTSVVRLFLGSLEDSDMFGMGSGGLKEPFSELLV